MPHKVSEHLSQSPCVHLKGLMAHRNARRSVLEDFGSPSVSDPVASVFSLEILCACKRIRDVCPPHGEAWLNIFTATSPPPPPCIGSPSYHGRIAKPNARKQELFHGDSPSSSWDMLGLVGLAFPAHVHFVRQGNRSVPRLGVQGLYVRYSCRKRCLSIRKNTGHCSSPLLFPQILSHKVT
jgi:hypothetical protein